MFVHARKMGPDAVISHVAYLSDTVNDSVPHFKGKLENIIWFRRFANRLDKTQTSLGNINQFDQSFGGITWEQALGGHADLLSIKLSFFKSYGENVAALAFGRSCAWDFSVLEPDWF